MSVVMVRKARKDHRCFNCGHIIPAGTRYRLAKDYPRTGVGYGDTAGHPVEGHFHLIDDDCWGAR